MNKDAILAIIIQVIVSLFIATGIGKQIRFTFRILNRDKNSLSSPNEESLSTTVVVSSSITARPVD